MQENYANIAKTAANYVPLSPISFLNSAESLHGSRPAVIYGDLRYSWSELSTRIRALAAGLTAAGIGKGDTVSVLCPNTPQLFELHFALPLTGGVLNALNTRCLLYTSDAADEGVEVLVSGGGGGG